MDDSDGNDERIPPKTIEREAPMDNSDGDEQEESDDNLSAIDESDHQMQSTSDNEHMMHDEIEEEFKLRCNKYPGIFCRKVGGGVSKNGRRSYFSEVSQLRLSHIHNTVI